MIRTVLSIIFLIINTVWDIKTKKLSLVVLLGFGVTGVIINLVLPEYSSVELISGMAVGAALMIISYVTAGQIGEGDGLLFIIMGIYIGGINNIRLLLWASVICALVAGVLLVTRQVGRKDKIPFVPFVLFAYIGQVVL